MPTIVTRLGKGSPLTTAELDANLTNINAETVDNSGVFNLRPSLDIDLVGSKSVSPLVSFSRSSTGTYFDSDGLLKTAGVNQPRFDYDSVTGELKGLLVEESRTNTILSSSNFSSGGWSNTGISSISANISISPNGSVSATKIIEDSSSGRHFLQISTSPTFPATLSIFAKAAEQSKLFIGDGQAGAAVIFDLTGDGSIFSQNSSYAPIKITNIGNGWYRCSITKPSAGAGATMWVGIANSSGQVSYQGDTSKGIYIWGAQIESGNILTSYIPTTSTAVTRSADQLSINKTSNWFNSTNGTLSLSHDAASGQPLLGDGSSTVISSLGAGTVNIDYSNTQLSVVTQSGQSNNTTGIFNFDTDLYIGGNSTSKINNHIKYLKFYPNNVINSTPDGSGLLLDTGFALLQEDGSVIFQE